MDVPATTSSSRNSTKQLLRKGQTRLMIYILILTQNCREPMIHQILSSANYQSSNILPSEFDPHTFDIAHARKRISDALSSTTFEPPAPAYAFHFDPKDPEGHGMKGNKYFKVESAGKGHTFKMVQHEKERRVVSVCASCGKPDVEQLKKCGACRQIL